MCWYFSPPLLVTAGLDWLGMERPVALLSTMMGKQLPKPNGTLPFSTRGGIHMAVALEGGQKLLTWVQRSSQSPSWHSLSKLRSVSVCFSISAQSNFAVGAVVNATFGSITELTFYITALIKGTREGNKCYEEIVKAALTGTLVGCVLFVPVSLAGSPAARSCSPLALCPSDPRDVCFCLSVNLSHLPSLVSSSWEWSPIPVTTWGQGEKDSLGHELSRDLAYYDPRAR